MDRPERRFSVIGALVTVGLLVGVVAVVFAMVLPDEAPAGYARLREHLDEWEPPASLELVTEREEDEGPASLLPDDVAVVRVYGATDEPAVTCAQVRDSLSPWGRITHATEVAGECLFFGRVDDEVGFEARVRPRSDYAGVAGSPDAYAGFVSVVEMKART